MQRKGLCVNCDYAGGCELFSGLSVWHCEEFCIESGKKGRKTKKNKLKKMGSEAGLKFGIFKG